MFLIRGTTWGLGGTCVNVGCVPKKLFHNASLLKEQIELAQYYGFHKLQGNEEIHVKAEYFVWERLRDEVQQYIKSSNFGFKS